MNTKTLILIFVSTLAVILAAIFTWRILASDTNTQTSSTQSFATSQNQTTTTGTQTTTTGDTSTPVVGIASTKVFKIAEGPITGAVFYQAGRPTTTVVRYVKADNGHIFDLTIDTPGAVSRSISNTTIPGAVEALWTGGGSGAVLQYLEDSTIKTARLNLPLSAGTSTATSSPAVRVQFLLNDITSISVSPDGRTLAYTIETSSGVDGYTASADGSNQKKIFSFPLKKVLLSWGSSSTLLLQTPSSAGVPGMAFSVNASSGAVSPILYTDGLTALASQTFGYILYQTRPATGIRSTYFYNVSRGVNTNVSSDPYPEKCAWSPVASTTVYCASPLGYTANNFLDLWHQGRSGVADSLFVFEASTGRTAVVAAPGTADGGELSNIAEIGISPDESYVWFIRKGDRSLWGVRLK